MHTTKEHAKWTYLFMLVMIREKPMEMYNGCAAWRTHCMQPTAGTCPPRPPASRGWRGRTARSCCHGTEMSKLYSVDLLRGVACMLCFVYPKMATDCKSTPAHLPLPDWSTVHAKPYMEG